MSFEFHLPDLAEGMTEAEVVSWKVAVGDKVELDQPVVEVMSDKATVEIPSPRAGTIAKLNFDAGDVCPVGQVLFVIEEEGGSAAAKPVKAAGSGAVTAAPAKAAAAPAPAPRVEVIDASSDRKRVLATPATRRLARTMGIDIAQVPGTGKRGRVTREDVERFKSGGASSPAVARPAHTPISIPSEGAEERIPLRGVRKRIAENMARSAFTAAHFTYVEEVDTTDLVQVRSRAKERAAERGIKLTYLPFIIKAVVAGLKKWPALNASLDEATQEIVRKGYYHIGVAAQGPQGLAVTVVRDCDKRSIFEIAAEIERLSKAVQEGTATRDDLTGSTFTISSLGKLGGLHATPIINFPEVGILGVHKMEQRPAVVDGAIVARWRMNLAISLDHRIVDGWDGAMFVQDVKSLLEDPTMMFMEMV
jgi:pyruvate dehydrogenase E2 component (dihydrolipoamide acetyltransferase)